MGRKKARGLWDTHRWYRKQYKSALAADLVDDERGTRRRIRELWRPVVSHVTHEHKRDVSLLRYFRMFHGGKYTIKMWNDAVNRYVDQLNFSGLGSNNVRKLLPHSRSDGHLYADDCRNRITEKRWVDQHGYSGHFDDTSVLGQVFTYGQIRARIARFEMYQEQKAQRKARELREIGKKLIERAQETKRSTCQLYRHFDPERRLLYVGISNNHVNRLAAHRNDSAWFPLIKYVEIEHFDTRAQAEAAERHAIRTELPIFNRAHSTLRLVA